MSKTNRPLLASAFICERVLQEKDEVLSAIRMVDKFFVTIPKNLPSDMNPSVLLTIILGFKKAALNDTKKHRARLRLQTPSGQPRPLSPSPSKMDFAFPEGQPASANLIVTINLGVKEFGLFWIDVLLDDETE